jgi:broad specificity phosphatase PhoE
MAVNITYFVHGTSKDNENEISSGWNDTELKNRESISKSMERLFY